MLRILSVCIGNHRHTSRQSCSLNLIIIFRHKPALYIGFLHMKGIVNVSCRYRTVNINHIQCQRQILFTLIVFKHNIVFVRKCMWNFQIRRLNSCSKSALPAIYYSTDIILTVYTVILSDTIKLSGNRTLMHSQ